MGNIRKKLFRIIENIDSRDRFCDTYDNSIRKITTLYCFDFFSRMERACMFARGRFIFFWMKRSFFIQYKCFIDTRFSRCSSQEFAGFTVCERFPSLLYYLSLSIFIYRSIYFKIVWPQVCSSLLMSQSVDVIVTRKRELSQVKSQIFVCGGLGNFPQKIFARRKFPDKLSLNQ